MLGALLLVALTLTSVVVARLRGFTVARTLAFILGVLLGGAIGAAPGAYLVVGTTVFHATGTGQLPFYLQDDVPFGIFVAGGAFGAVGALLALDRLGGRRTPATRLGAAGLLAFAAGVAVSLVALVFGQHTPYELAVFVLIPVSVAAEMVAAYALVTTRR